MTKLSLKGAWSGYVNHLNLSVVTNHISGTAAATFVKFWTQVGYIKPLHMDDKSPLKGA